VLACPAFTDGPKDKDKKEETPKEQYAALVKEFTSKRTELVAEINKSKGDDQKKLIEKYQDLGKDYADRFLKLAEDHPKAPAATDALLWVLQNANGSDAAKTAGEKISAMIAEAPLAEVLTKIETLRIAPPTVVDAVVKRAEKDEKDPKAAELEGWVATRAPFSPAGEKAIKSLVEKHPDSPAIAQLCQMLGSGRFPSGDAMLKTILEKSTKPAVKGAAALALGQALASKVDDLADKPAEADKTAAEGEKYLTMAAELLKDEPARKKAAESELRALRTLRVGKEAPEIKAGDLDGQSFKLSDYRGKVVLLDFWGDW
jgi:hypothetical protein